MINITIIFKIIYTNSQLKCLTNVISQVGESKNLSSSKRVF